MAAKNLATDKNRRPPPSDRKIFLRPGIASTSWTSGKSRLVPAISFFGSTI